MTILRQAADIASLLALSDERDLWSRRILDAERRGYQRGRADGYDAGYTDGILGRKRARHQAVEALDVYLRRWKLRGETRTRSTFGQPHPADYPGRGAA